MFINTLTVSNFRSIRKETLDCENLTALVGPNGAGKSTFLRALQAFYETSYRVAASDFHNGNTAEPITIAITYSDLSPTSRAQFKSYINGETLTVEKVFTGDGSRSQGRYYGSTLQNPAFRAVREGLQIKDRGRTARDAYETLRTTRSYSILPEWSKLVDVEPALQRWELDHPGECARHRDDGQFFGFTAVASGYLGRFTSLLYIPAVREASSDAAEARGSVFSELMDLVVRSALVNNDRLVRLQERTQRLFERAISGDNVQELATLGEKLTNSLKQFVPAASVELDWSSPPRIDLPVPKAAVKIIEEDYGCEVENVGHGLQRAFIITLLQHLTLAQVRRAREGDEQNAELPTLVLAIEEPELYQHPNRQRHFAALLRELAQGNIPGVADKTQMVYTTHSPLFVGIDRINQLRMIRRLPEVGHPLKCSKVIKTNLDAVAHAVWEANGSRPPPYTAETLIPRLQAIMTPWMSEGFFGDLVVLVEGEDDRAALLGFARARDYEFAANGISIIPCGGKTCIDRPAIIFSQLGIPVYLVWDGDNGEKDARPADNHRLLRLLGEPATDWPTSFVGAKYACFEVDLETTMRSEIGEREYSAIVQEAQATFGIPKRKHALKNPQVVTRIVEQCTARGHTCPTLTALIDQVWALRQ